MSKAIVSIGYRKFVLPLDVAVRLVETLSDAEHYDSGYVKDQSTGNQVETHHIYIKDDAKIKLEIISDVQYNKFKLAGAPQDPF